jgi:hypothetical protein
MRTAIWATLMLLFLPVAGFTQTLPTAKGDIILTVSWNGSDQAGGMAELDLEVLSTLGTKILVTETIWTDGPQEFEGVELTTLTDALGISTGTLKAIAHNDYAVEIPLSDVTTKGALIAFKRNGDTMHLREKGPIWIVFPYDHDAMYRSEVVHSRSIWQLARIEILQ